MKTNSLELFAVVAIVVVTSHPSLASPDNKYKCFVQNKCEEKSPEMTSFVHKGTKYCCRGGDELTFFTESSSGNFMSMNIWSSGRAVSANDDDAPSSKVPPAVTPTSLPTKSFDSSKEDDEDINIFDEIDEVSTIELQQEPQQGITTPGIPKFSILVDKVNRLGDDENTPESEQTLADRGSADESDLEQTTVEKDLDENILEIMNTPSEHQVESPYHTVFKRDVSQISDNIVVSDTEGNNSTELERGFQPPFEENNGERSPQVSDSEYSDINANSDEENGNIGGRVPQVTDSESSDDNANLDEEYGKEQVGDFDKVAENREKGDKLDATMEALSKAEEGEEIISCSCQAIDPTDNLFSNILDNALASRFLDISPSWNWPWNLPRFRRMPTFTWWFPQP